MKDEEELILNVWAHARIHDKCQMPYRSATRVSVPPFPISSEPYIQRKQGFLPNHLSHVYHLQYVSTKSQFLWCRSCFPMIVNLRWRAKYFMKLSSFIINEVLRGASENYLQFVVFFEIWFWTSVTAMSYHGKSINQVLTEMTACLLHVHTRCCGQ